MTEGTIRLYDKTGNLVTAYIYHSPAQRSKKIELWKKLYGQAFNRCTLIDTKE